MSDTVEEVKKLQVFRRAVKGSLQAALIANDVNFPLEKRLSDMTEELSQLRADIARLETKTDSAHQFMASQIAGIRKFMEHMYPDFDFANIPSVGGGERTSPLRMTNSSSQHSAIPMAENHLSDTDADGDLVSDIEMGPATAVSIQHPPQNSPLLENPPQDRMVVDPPVTVQDNSKLSAIVSQPAALHRPPTPPWVSAQSASPPKNPPASGPIASSTPVCTIVEEGTATAIMDSVAPLLLNAKSPVPNYSQKDQIPVSAPLPIPDPENMKFAVHMQERSVISTKGNVTLTGSLTRSPSPARAGNINSPPVPSPLQNFMTDRSAESDPYNNKDKIAVLDTPMIGSKNAARSEDQTDSNHVSVAATNFQSEIGELHLNELIRPEILIDALCEEERMEMEDDPDANNPEAEDSVPELQLLRPPVNHQHAKTRGCQRSASAEPTRASQRLLSLDQNKSQTTQSVNVHAGPSQQHGRRLRSGSVHSGS